MENIQDVINVNDPNPQAQPLMPPEEMDNIENIGNININDELEQRLRDDNNVGGAGAGEGVGAGNNNGQAGDHNQNEHEVDRRQQENNPNVNVNVNDIDDVEIEQEEPVIQRSNSFRLDDMVENRNRRPAPEHQGKYNPLVGNEDELQYLPDIGARTKDVVKDQLAKERERLRRQAEQLAKERAKLKAEKQKLEEEKKKLAALKKKQHLDNKKRSKYKKTEKPDEKESEKRGYKIGEIKDGVTSSQKKKINGLKHLTWDIDKKFRSSPQFKKVKNSLGEFDEFMKSISGRTRLTSAEMEMYDKLSLKCYNATNEYLEKKIGDSSVDVLDKDEERLTIDVNGERLMPKSEHERIRISQAKEIKNSIDEMRKEMFKAQLDFKIKEMDKKCEDALKQEEKNRGDLLTNKMSDEELKTAMTESVSKTLFYANRMDNLKKHGGFDIKAGEKFTDAYKRLDNSLTPKPEDMAKNMKDPNFMKIVDAGVAAVKSGKAFTAGNINDMFKQAAIEESNKKLEEKRRLENAKKPEEIHKNNPEMQNAMNK
ncbi:MAG: hypothetical protein K5659_05290 [Lachnospiraceae bacterium]|nr:hypothetical protein [Lachnospiraceae bacterium]